MPGGSSLVTAFPKSHNLETRQTGRRNAASMLPNIKKYLHHFDGCALSVEEKERLARDLWKALEILVDQVIEGGLDAGAQVPKDAGDAGPMLEFSNRFQDRFALAPEFSQAAHGAEKGPQDE